MGFRSGLSMGEFELARTDIIFNEGGRSTGDDDTVFMNMDRIRDENGSTERGGDSNIAVGELEAGAVRGGEKDSIVAVCAEA